MAKKALQLAESLQEIWKDDNTSCAKAVELSVAFATASLFAINPDISVPSSNYFNSQYLIDARKLISSLNEICIFNMERALEKTKAFFVLRSDIAKGELFTPSNFSKMDNFFTCVFGIENLFSEEEKKFLNANPLAVAKTINLLINWIRPDEA